MNDSASSPFVWYPIQTSDSSLPEQQFSQGVRIAGGNPFNPNTVGAFSIAVSMGRLFKEFQCLAAYNALVQNGFSELFAIRILNQASSPEGMNRYVLARRSGKEISRLKKALRIAAKAAGVPVVIEGA